MELTYHRCGDYLYPNLVLESEDLPPLGKYGLMRRSYLKDHRTAWYKSMLLTGELDQHLVEIDQAADARIERIIEQLEKRSHAPDKETDQLGWVAHMNALQGTAEEIVLRELVFCQKP